MKTWLRWLGWAGIVLAFAVMFAWLVLPRVLQSQGERWLSGWLGREVRIGQVHLRPWSLELTLRDLVVAGASPERPLLRVGRVYANAEISSVWEWAPVLSAFEIDAPVLNVTRLADGRYDVDDVLERLLPAPADPSAGDPASPGTPGAPTASATPADASGPAASAPAPTRDGDDAPRPPRFALHNLQLRDGSLRFADEPVSRVHELHHLVLTLPFLSNLPADVEVKVEPRLAFALDDAVFDSGAQSTPFAQHRSTALRLRIGGDANAADNGELDLTGYVGYLPRQLPVRLVRGFVAADLDLRFSIEANGQPNVALSGLTRARDVELTDVAGAPLLQWRRLALDWKEVRPISRRLSFGELRLDGAQLTVERNAAGQLNLERLADSGGSGGTPAGGWQVAIASVVVDDSRVQFRDASTRPAVDLAAEDVSIGLRDLRWPVAGAVPLNLNAIVRPGGPAGAAQSANNGRKPPAPAVLARLEAEGEAEPSRLALAWRVSELRLAPLQPYLAPLLSPTLQPRVEGRARLSGRLEAGSKPEAVLRLSVDDGEVEAPRLLAGQGAATEELFAASAWRVSRLELDAMARRLSIGRVEVQSPSATLERSASGRWNVQDWWAAPAAGAADGAQGAPSPEAGSAPGWDLRLAAFALEGGRLRLVDRGAPVEGRAAAGRASAPAPATPRRAPTLPLGREPAARLASPSAPPATGPAVFELQPLRASVEQLALAPDGTLSTARTSLQASLAAGDAPAAAGARPARLAWDGRVSSAPWRADGAVRIDALPLPAFERYVSSDLRLDLRRADAHYQGRLSARQERRGLALSAQGALRVADLELSTRAVRPGDAVDDLLSWRQLGLDGLRVSVEPGRRPRIDIGQAELHEFFSRLVVTESGRFNLLDLDTSPGSEATPPAARADAAPPAGTTVDAPGVAERSAEPATSYPVPTSGGGSYVGGRVPPDMQRGFAPAAAASPRADRRLPVDLSVQAIRLVDGRVAFTDRFVQPNFSAELGALNGRIGAFRSGSADMAPIEIDGSVAQTGRLRIAGRLNPTADPLALDVDAQATRIELPPLTPYAGKYVGFEIDRGRLDLAVRYDVKPDGRLDAKHHVLLDQLRFGERVESPQATNLPVRLAVALLQDRDGRIEFDLPVSGSLDNPQFSVFGVVTTMLGNLVARAATAPFGLLGGSDNEDLGVVEFEPGTVVPTSAGQATIDRLARALLDRPHLKATLTGTTAPQVERDDLRHAMFERRLVRQAEAPPPPRRSLVPWRSGAPLPGSPSAGAPPAGTLAARSAAGAAPAVEAPPEAGEMLPPAAREQALRRLYRETELPDKPRNFLGIARDIPPEQMEAMLFAQVRVDDAQWQALALARATTVRDALLARGLPAERLFLGNPRVHEAVGPTDDDGHPWTPRTQLTLSAS